MKLIDLFNSFLVDAVNLNSTRVTELATSTEAIKKAIRESSWAPHINGWMEHGSWAHSTIIRPVDGGEFDADLLVFVEHVEGWSAATYIEQLYGALRDNDIYKHKVSRSSHCVTISYANDKKIDVAPCLTNRPMFNQLEVCNRHSDQFERSEPRLFTEWLVKKNSYSGNNSFRKVTRLVKYLRDIKTRFTCSSVLLTTLLASFIVESDKDTDGFADTPTALKTVIGRLDDWLQANAIKPRVTNPFLTTENFADAWDDAHYTNFREKIHLYREWVDDAYSEQDRSESIAKWRRLFGDDFASGVVLEEGKSVSNLLVAKFKAATFEARQFTGDLVDAVRRFGSQVLPDSFNRLPYMQAPTWRRAAQQIPVQVRADLHRSNNNTQMVRPVSALEPLPAGHWLHFKAVTNTGLPFDRSNYIVMWRVTNTDEAAARENQLRGRFEKPEYDNSRWEPLRFRGVHLVEAFIVSKRDDRLVGISEAFRVMIE